MVNLGVREVIKDTCDGCQEKWSSQKDHACLMEAYDMAHNCIHEVFDNINLHEFITRLAKEAGKRNITLFKPFDTYQLIKMTMAEQIKTKILSGYDMWTWTLFIILSYICCVHCSIVSLKNVNINKKTKIKHYVLLSVVWCDTSMAKWHRRWTPDPMEFIPSWVRIPVLEMFFFVYKLVQFFENKKKSQHQDSNLGSPGYQPDVINHLTMLLTFIWRSYCILY